MKYLKITFLSLLIVSGYTFAQEAEAPAPTNLDQLLELVKEGKSKEQGVNKKREAEFKASRDKQDQILKAEQRELVRQEKIADQLEEEFIKNQEKLRIAEEKYLKQLGSLNEIFGHIQSISTDSRVTFETSLTAAEFGKDREIFLGELTRKMGDSTELPSTGEIQELLDEIVIEMIATGQVSRFNRDVINVDGTQTNCEVVRVGVITLFAIISI